MVVGAYTAPAGRSDGKIDRAVLLSCAVALVCGGACAAAALAVCADQVFRLFVPELGWLVVVPAVVILWLGAIGLCAACRPASKLFRAQLATFFLVLAVILTGAGVFALISSDDASRWIDDGCENFRMTGLWRSAGRVKEKLRELHGQYVLLRGGWEHCRAVNPLVYDLAVCGVRALCADGQVAAAQPRYGWIKHVQLTYSCGGFCTDEVPVFGAGSMQETLLAKTACAARIQRSVRNSGRLLTFAAALCGVLVGTVALILFCASRHTHDDWQEVDLSDSSDDEWEARTALRRLPRPCE